MVIQSIIIFGYLLKKKFSNSFNNVPASWLISRIRCRSTKLGYLVGSFSVLINKLIENLRTSKIKIRLNTKINKVSLIYGNKIKISTANEEIIKDIVVFSCPQKVTSNLLGKENKYLVADIIEYLSATCVIIYLDKNPFNDYWINYCDDATKALAVINHSIFMISKI